MTASAEPGGGTGTTTGTTLTDREIEIVRLVAQARTNQQIASALHISIRTVHAHLQSAYDKTGTHNRVQITNWLWGTE